MQVLLRMYSGRKRAARLRPCSGWQALSREAALPHPPKTVRSPSRSQPAEDLRLLKTFVAMRVVWTISRALLRPGWNPRPHLQHLELLRFHMRQLGTLEKEISSLG